MSQVGKDLRVNVIQAESGRFERLLFAENLVVASAMKAEAVSMQSSVMSELTFQSSDADAAEVPPGTLKYRDGVLYMSGNEQWGVVGPLNAGQGIVLTPSTQGLTIATQNVMVGNQLMASNEFVVTDPTSAKAWRIRAEGDNLIFEFGTGEGGDFVWERACFHVSAHQGPTS